MVSENKYLKLVDKAKNYWESLSDYRQRRMRSRDYLRGRPNETIIDPDTGKEISEDEYIRSQGRIPFKINRIRPIVMNLKGQYRQIKFTRMVYPRNRDDNEAGEIMTEALNYIYDINNLEQLDADCWEEALVSGLYGWKSGYKWVEELQRSEVVVDMIDTTRIFFNDSIKDKRGTGLNFIGEIYDAFVEDLVVAFARNRQEAEAIREIYKEVDKDVNRMIWERGFYQKDALNFFYPLRSDMARVVEIWQKEYKWQRYVHDWALGIYEETDLTDEEVEEINIKRRQDRMAMNLPNWNNEVEIEEKYVPYWKYYFLSPNGYLLTEGESPYWHKETPYNLGFLTLFDNEIWGLVEDIIDPQILVNRLTTAIDYLFGVSAKGVLLVPEDSIPEGMTLQQFADEWTKFNGVIAYKPKYGVPAPQQLVQNSIPMGIFEWLSRMTLDMKEVSGVIDAVQGLTPPSGTAAALYQQQILQGKTTNYDYFDSFIMSKRRRDVKLCKLIAQYYDEELYLKVVGNRPDGKKYIRFRPDKVRDIEFDVVMGEVTDTIAARQLMEQDLKELLMANRITLRQFLLLSSNPKADIILDIINRTNPALADGQIDPQAVNGLMMQAQQNNPEAITLLNQLK